MELDPEIDPSRDAMVRIRAEQLTSGHLDADFWDCRNQRSLASILQFRLRPACAGSDALRQAMCGRVTCIQVGLTPAKHLLLIRLAISRTLQL